MPLALITGIATVALVYITINVAYFIVLDVDTMKSSNAVAAVSRARKLRAHFASFGVRSCLVSERSAAFRMRCRF